MSVKDINREESVGLEEDHCHQDKLVGWEIETLYMKMNVSLES